MTTITFQMMNVRYGLKSFDNAIHVVPSLELQVQLTNTLAG